MYRQCPSANTVGNFPEYTVTNAWQENKINRSALRNTNTPLFLPYKSKLCNDTTAAQRGHFSLFIHALPAAKWVLRLIAT